MTTTHIIQTSGAILAGAAFLTLAGYLLVKFLGNCRDNKDQIERQNDQIFERHISKKP